MSQVDQTREHLIEVYRKKAKRYDVTSRLYPAPGYPQAAQRRRAVQELRIDPGDTVVDMACGTGLNFSLLEEAVGPEGRIVGVDLTDAMLDQARQRIERNGWSNVSLVQADAAEFDFPDGVDAILSTYALTQVPECGAVIARGAAALSGGGRWAVLDLKVPDSTPRWLAHLGIATVRPFASIEDWVARRPWEAIRAGMQETLTDVSWAELFFGTAFLACGRRTVDPGCAASANLGPWTSTPREARMGAYTKINLKKIEAGGSGEVEARFARKHLDSDHLGLSLFRYGSGYRSRTGHSHREQEEVYVVVGGSGRVKLDDEVLELRPWDVVRVAPSTVRAFEGGPDGLELLAIGSDRPEGGDGVRIDEWWSD